MQELTTNERKEAIEYHMAKIIIALGLDTNSPHLRDTPKRVAKMYVDEVFSGVYSEPPVITDFEDEIEFISTNHRGMVFLGNIDLFSTCSHHFLPFTGKAHIGYLPKKKLVGISKLARITDWFARRPQVQENLSDQIADYLMEQLDAEGVGVYTEAVHDCIRVRGAKQSSSVMVYTSIRGNFLTDKEVEREFENKVMRMPNLV